MWKCKLVFRQVFTKYWIFGQKFGFCPSVRRRLDSSSTVAMWRGEEKKKRSRIAFCCKSYKNGIKCSEEEEVLLPKLKKEVGKILEVFGIPDTWVVVWSKTCILVIPKYPKISTIFFCSFLLSSFSCQIFKNLARKISHHLPQLRSVGESRLALGARPCQFRALQKRGKIHLDNGVYSSKAQKNFLWKTKEGVQTVTGTAI